MVFVLHPWMDSSSPGHACRGTCLSIQAFTNTHPALPWAQEEPGCDGAGGKLWGAGAGAGKDWRMQGYIRALH